MEAQVAEKKRTGKVTFVGNPLKISGLLFNHYFPLDLSITKFCFQNCPFCFANLNRKATGSVIGKNEDPTDHFIRMLQKANGPGYNPGNLIEWCLNHKYPVVFSNNVDPFMPQSEDSHKLGERVLTECLEHRQPLYIQTKEVFPNEKVKQLIIQGKDLFQMYVSISTLSYETAKQYETIAVTPDQRLARIRELADAGVKVVVALNPYVPEWQPDLRAYFKAVAESGAKGVMADPLHFSAAQKKAASVSRLDQYIQKSNRYDDFYEDTRIMEIAAKENGIFVDYFRRKGDEFAAGANAFDINKIGWTMNADRLFQVIHRAYVGEGNNPIMITWRNVDEFYSQFPEWKAKFTINQFAGPMWTDNQTYFDVKAALGSRNTMKNVVKYIWNNPDSQAHFFSFFMDVFRLGDSEGQDKGEIDDVSDDQGDLIYVYDPEHKDDPVFWDQSDDKLKLKELIELQ